MLVAGVDEAGRGPWAGPVTAGAVILPAQLSIELQALDDSKKLSQKQRQQLADLIKQQAIAWSVVHISVAEIDRLNILQATLLGMRQAIEALSVQPQKALIDGKQIPDLSIPAEAIVGGDGKVAAISAASILAKTTRDELMQQLDQQFPNYGFAQHKGYGTKQHQQALRDLGVCSIHRKSYAPIKKLLAQGEPQ